MLCREYDVSESIALRLFRPVLGTEPDRIEAFVEGIIGLLKPVCRNVRLQFPASPIAVGIRKRPRFYNPNLGIESKMKHQGEFLILKPFKPIDIHPSRNGVNLSCHTTYNNCQHKYF